jgi:hypothetical protein
VRSYNEAKAAMAEYESSVVADWCRSVAATSDKKLNQPLLQVCGGGVEGLGCGVMGWAGVGKSQSVCRACYLART